MPVAPHPTLLKELLVRVSKFAPELPDLHCEASMDGGQYLWPNQLLGWLYSYASTQGFAVVTLSGSEQKGKIVFMMGSQETLGSLMIGWRRYCMYFAIPRHIKYKILAVQILIIK